MSVNPTSICKVSRHGGFTLRAAVDRDCDTIAEVWYRSWPDGHRGHVPEALYAFRELEHFRERVPERIRRTTVATLDNKVVGFVTVHDDELEQLFVAADARGGPCASLLLKNAEQLISRRFAQAWLAVATGNARARRFYARHHWLEAGAMEYPADVEGGFLFLPVCRYEKVLSSAANSLTLPPEDLP